MCQKCFNYYSEFVKRQRFCNIHSYDPVIEKITKERMTMISQGRGTSFKADEYIRDNNIHPTDDDPDLNPLLDFML